MDFGLKRNKRILKKVNSMKTEIKVKKQVEELQTIEVPAYFKSDQTYFRIYLDKEGNVLVDKLTIYPEKSWRNEQYCFVPGLSMPDMTNVKPITAREYWDVLGSMIFYLRILRDMVIPDSEFDPAPKEEGGC